MFHNVYIVIFSDQILNIKKEETRLFLKGLKIKKNKEKLQNHVEAHNIALAIFFLTILIKFLLSLVFFSFIKKIKFTP
jgi:hypothetical protein